MAIVPHFLNFNDLRARNIVRSRSHVKVLQEKHGFPMQMKLGPRAAGWPRISAWLETQQPKPSEA